MLLPGDLDLASLQLIRPIVYVLLYALDLTIDESTPFIGWLVEIDRRIQLTTQNFFPPPDRSGSSTNQFVLDNQFYQE